MSTLLRYQVSLEFFHPDSKSTVNAVTVKLIFYSYFDKVPLLQEFLSYILYLFFLFSKSLTTRSSEMLSKKLSRKGKKSSDNRDLELQIPEMKKLFCLFLCKTDEHEFI